MSHVALRDDAESRTSINAVAFARNESGSQLAPQNLGDIVRFAEVMSRADIAIPKHLRDNPGACLAVCMQAFKWEMDPFAVAQKSYKVGDQMAYEAQLIAAVINTRAGLKKRPKIEYSGEGQDRKCAVTFEADDGSTHVYESPRFGAITTKNSPLWKSDPDQQLGYYSVRAGARRHFPEVILGVYDRDEVAAARDITPEARPSFSDRVAKAQAESITDASEGFDRDFIDGELRGTPETATGEETASADEGESETTVAQSGRESEADAAPTSDESDPGEIDPADEREEPTVSEADRKRIASYARDLFGIVSSGDDQGIRKDRLGKSHQRWKTDIEKMPDEAQEMAKRVFGSAQAINRGDTGVESAAEFYADMLALPLDTVMPKGGE